MFYFSNRLFEKNQFELNVHIANTGLAKSFHSGFSIRQYENKSKETFGQSKVKCQGLMLEKLHAHETALNRTRVSSGGQGTGVPASLPAPSAGLHSCLPAGQPGAARHFSVAFPLLVAKCFQTPL